MYFLQGNEKKFLEFIDKIDTKDRIGIFTHDDTDGLASGIFIEKILSLKKLKVNFIEILSHRRNLWKGVKEQIKNKNLTKAFILDLSIDESQKNDFENLMSNEKILFIDHHPYPKEIKKIENVIRVPSDTGIGFLIFRMGVDNKLINIKEYKLIGVASGIAEYSYKNKENLDYMKKIFPKLNKEKIFDSSPGQLAKELSSAIVYYTNNKKKVYGFLKRKDFSAIKKASLKVEKEIQKYFDKFKEKTEYYPSKDIYFYQIKSKFKISSILSSMIAKENPNSVVIIAFFEGDFVKISARNYNSVKNVNIILEKLTKNIKDASMGGHTCASGAKFEKKYFNKFHENLKLINKNL